MRALFRYLLALAALLAIWQIGSLALGEFLLPRPLDVLAYFGEALRTFQKRPFKTPLPFPFFPLQLRNLCKIRAARGTVRMMV